MRLLIILVPLLLGGAGVFAVGYWFGRQGERTPDAAIALKELRLREHARLLKESREAHLAGDLGRADALERAAARVLDDATLDEFGR